MTTFYEYPKISAIFERLEDGSKLLDETKFSRDVFEYLKNDNWIGTEKLDGTNIGIYWDGHKIHIQGRTPDANFSALQFEYLMDRFGGSDNEELFEQNFGEKPVVLFGELVGKGIQACGGCYCPDGYRFVMFDVYFPDNNLWADKAALMTFADMFGVEYTIPVICGTLWECVDFVKKMPKSDFGNLLSEGIVVRPMIEMFDNQGKRVIAKIKVRDFIDAKTMKDKDMEYRNNG